MPIKSLVTHVYVNNYFQEDKCYLSVMDGEVSYPPRTRLIHVSVRVCRVLNARKHSRGSILSQTGKKYPRPNGELSVSPPKDCSAEDSKFGNAESRLEVKHPGGIGNFGALFFVESRYLSCKYEVDLISSS